MRLDDPAVRERVAAVDSALERVDAIPDPAARRAGRRAVQLLVELYGECLARVLDHARGPSAAGVRALAADELIGHLLVLHGLHPETVEDRLRGAVERLRPRAREAGVDVVLVAVEETTVRFRLDGGGPGPRAELRRAIERAAREAAPEIAHVAIEDDSPHPVSRLIPVASLGGGAG